MMKFGVSPTKERSNLMANSPTYRTETLPTL